MKKILTSIIATILFVYSYAQETPATQEVQSGLRANDKIWVVMTICLTILIGLFLYLISIDRKLSKLEKK